MIDLNYERRGRAAVGDARALVLIHGIGSRWQMWEPVLDRLAAEHDVIVLDLPGFGKSPLPPATSDPGPRGLAEEVASFLGGLGVERPHVVGNSLGGWVALELAVLGQVSSVTTLSPAGFAGRADSVWARSNLLLSRGMAKRLSGVVDGLSKRARFRWLVYQLMVAHPENVPADEVAGSIRALADAPGFDATLRASIDAGFHLGRPLEVPVTIGWGARDRLLPPHQAKRAAAELPGARLVSLPGCGHIPTYDDPELVARVILEGMSAS